MEIRGFSSGLYGWIERSILEHNTAEMNAVLRDCAQSGLDALEIDANRESLDKTLALPLKVSGMYWGSPLHEPWGRLRAANSVLPLVERLASAGATHFIANADPKGGWDQRLPKTEEELRYQGENLSRLADLVRPLKLSLHNHGHTQDLALADLRSVIEYADATVGLCVDTGWACVAECDPVSWVLRYPERIFAVHLRNQRGSIPTEDLMEGDVDMHALMEALRTANYRGWLTLELWHPPETQPLRTMVEDVRRSIAYLRELIGREAVSS